MRTSAISSRTLRERAVLVRVLGRELLLLDLEIRQAASEAADQKFVRVGLLPLRDGLGQLRELRPEVLDAAGELHLAAHGAFELRARRRNPVEQQALLVFEVGDVVLLLQRLVPRLGPVQLFLQELGLFLEKLVRLGRPVHIDAAVEKLGDDGVGDRGRHLRVGVVEADLDDVGFLDGLDLEILFQLLHGLPGRVVVGHPRSGRRADRENQLVSPSFG